MAYHNSTFWQEGRAARERVKADAALRAATERIRFLEHRLRRAECELAALKQSRELSIRAWVAAWRPAPKS